MHEQDEVLDNGENMVQKPQHDVIQGQFQVMIIKQLMKMKKQALPFVKKRLKRHIDLVHECGKYPCCQCDQKATRHNHLKTHIDSKYKCQFISVHYATVY